MIPAWNIALGTIATAIIFAAGAVTGTTFERDKWQAAEIVSAKDADKLAVERLDAMGAGLLAIDFRLAAIDAAQVKGLYDVRQAVAANRPPSDGCRLDAAAAERLRNVFEAANASRAGDVRARTDSDDTRAGPRD